MTVKKRWEVLRKTQLAFFSRALLVDWLVPLLVLNSISSYIQGQEPFHRPVENQLDDPGIKYSYEPDQQVSMELLDTLAFWLPAALIVVISLARRSIHEAHHGLLALVGSRSVMRLTVEFVKNRVGRLRPDFLARCKWSDVIKDCTGISDVVHEGRRSFPSGHSATAWQGLLVLALFIAGKNGAFALNATFPSSGFIQSRQLRFAVAVSPLFLAAWISITRLEDHYHHPTDLLAGSIIGALSAYSIYVLYYPSPFDSTALSYMDKPNVVYEGDEGEDVGAILLDDEERGGGLLPEGSGSED